MSADEIRRLADAPSVQFGGYYSPAEKIMIHDALLSYSGVVERCEERRYENMDLIDYILKGATDERK